MIWAISSAALGGNEVMLRMSGLAVPDRLAARQPLDPAGRIDGEQLGPGDEEHGDLVPTRTAWVIAVPSPHSRYASRTGFNSGVPGSSRWPVLIFLAGGRDEERAGPLVQQLLEVRRHAHRLEVPVAQAHGDPAIDLRPHQRLALRVAEQVNQPVRMPDRADRHAAVGLRLENDRYTATRSGASSTTSWPNRRVSVAMRLVYESVGSPTSAFWYCPSGRSPRP